MDDVPNYGVQYPQSMLVADDESSSLMLDNAIAMHMSQHEESKEEEQT